MQQLPKDAGRDFSRGLVDRDGLVRKLGRQMRERLAGDADLGMLQAVALMGWRPDFHWAIEHFLRH